MGEGDTVLVTGASSGIGLAVVRSLLAQSVSVIGVARKANPLAGEGAGSVRWVRCDLADFDQLSATLGPMLRNQPALRATVLCHGYGDFGSLEQFSVERIERLISTNLTSHLLVTRLVLPIMKTRGQGDLVFIGSESALRGGKKGAVYCAAKFGLRGFAQSLRADCASANVRVCMINPGMVDTPFFDTLDFSPGHSADCRISSDEVARTVLTALQSPAGTVIDEINLSPIKTIIYNK